MVNIGRRGVRLQGQHVERPLGGMGLTGVPALFSGSSGAPK